MGESVDRMLRLAHVHGFTGQGWHTQETMWMVKWIMSHDEVLQRALMLARRFPKNPHTVADTLHEDLVPRSELEKMAAAGCDPAKIDWLEIAHEIIERRNDPQPSNPSEHAMLSRADEQMGKMLPLPPTPRNTRAMMTAHRINDMQVSLAHAHERMTAAQKSKDMGLRKYETVHVRNHLARVMAAGHMLADNLRKNYPAEGKELNQLTKVLGLSKSVSPSAKAATTAHLLQSILNDGAHAVCHSAQMATDQTAREWEFDADHAHKHVLGALEHACKLGNHMKDNYPEEGRLLSELEAMAQSDKTQAYVKASSPSAWPDAGPYRSSFLSPVRDGPKTVSAPGAGTFVYGRLRQEPSQTVSPSPPLPPSVPIPSPKEMRAFAAQLGKMKDDDENHHLAGAVMHLESAAEKMPNNPVSALASLRSAQMAIQNEWRERVMRNHPRIAYVFSDNSPPAEQAKQKQAWAKAQAQIGQMQGAASKIAEFIDRVRRNYFGAMGMHNGTAGGGLNGQPNARL